MSSSPLRRRLTLLASVTLLFWAAARLGLQFDGIDAVTPVWPPAAVAAVAGILYGPQWLAGAAAYIVYDFIDGTHGAHLPYALVEPLAMMAATICCRLAARRLRFDGRLDSVRAVLAVMALGLVFAVVNGSIDSVGYCALAHSPRCVAAGWMPYWLQSAGGDLFGCLVCMPALLSWARWADQRLRRRSGVPPNGVERRRVPRPTSVPWPPRERVESGGHWPAVLTFTREHLAFTLVGLAVSALGVWATHRWQVPVHVVGYLALPVLVWAAIKFSPLFVHTAILVTGLVTISVQLTAPGASHLDPVSQTAALFLFLLTVSTLTLIVNVVVQQQRRLAGELAYRAQQERVELMLQSATDAVISFDDRGRLFYWNPAAARLFGRSAAAMLGRPVTDVLPLPKLVAAGEGLAALCEARDEVFSGALTEFNATDALGHPLPVELSLSAYRHDRGWVATAFIRDGRAKKRHEEALRQARDRAEEAARAKSLFLATMSHELRTPLSGVIGMLQLALREPLPPQAQSRVSLGLGNAEALLDIINDLLDYSKIEAGKMVFESVDFDPRELLRSLIELLDLRAQEEGLSLVGDVQSSVPAWLRGDPMRLRQILLNLIGNALKFTEAGTVQVRVACVADGAKGLLLELEVEDTGIGISDEAQARLFNSFEQADVTTTRKYGGTGLGLTITRALVEGMSGRITLRSEVGRGSTFRVVLPIQPGAPVVPVPREAVPPFDCRLRVLCAEDGYTNRVIVEAFVQGLGHDITFVENGRQAVERCAQEYFDVLLMDGRMPVMDGLTAARAIRSGGLGDAWVIDPGIWMIALTANATGNDRALSLEAGMNDFLSKPVDERQLARALHRAVEGLRARGRGLRPARGPAPAAVPGTPGASGPAGADAAASPTPIRSLAERLAVAFRKETPRLVADLDDALARGDHARAARIAHNIKGSAFYINCEPMADVAGALEDACDAGDAAAAAQRWSELRRDIDRWLEAHQAVA